MAEQEEFFVPEEIDKQIENVKQFLEGDRLDAEAMAYLRSHYQTDARREEEALDRIWKRITNAPLFEHTAQKRERKLTIMQDSQLPPHAGSMNSFHQPRRTSLWHRVGLVAAVVLLVALIGSTALILYTARQSNNGTASPNSTPANTAQVPLKVTAVDMSVSPGSIADLTCGTNLTVTYTALFHVVPNSVGGTVQFNYTINNGRLSTPANITFAPGETTKQYSFTWHGALPIDHTYPEAGGVQVTSPNQLTSALLAPTGQCVPGNFRVTKVDMAVSPASVQGMACGTTATVTYTATIHVASDTSGGTVKFSYTVNNGRSQTPASLTFEPGVTTKQYSFTWSGALPADHTYPGPGGIQISSPNQLTSALLAPTGQCSSSTALQVTKVDMAVSPTSVQGLACGTTVTVTYTATIHVAPSSSGGTVQFSYTVNNGRSQTPASLTFAPGETTKQYTFTWSGALPADHTYPGPGGIQISSPNQLTSTLVAPTGACS